MPTQYGVPKQMEMLIGLIRASLAHAGLKPWLFRGERFLHEEGADGLPWYEWDAEYALPPATRRSLEITADVQLGFRVLGRSRWWACIDVDLTESGLAEPPDPALIWGAVLGSVEHTDVADGLPFVELAGLGSAYAPDMADHLVDGDIWGDRQLVIEHHYLPRSRANRRAKPDRCYSAIVHVGAMVGSVVTRETPALLLDGLQPLSEWIASALARLTALGLPLAPDRA